MHTKYTLREDLMGKEYIGSRKTLLSVFYTIFIVIKTNRLAIIDTNIFFIHKDFYIIL